MSESKEKNSPLFLADPWIAAFLAWLFPGLGHFYQGRKQKAVLYSVCVMTLFLIGIYLGSSSTFGPARNVYISLQKGSVRYYYLAQMWVGLPTVPAVVQFIRDPTGTQTDGRFMAPPMAVTSYNHNLITANSPTLDNIKKRLNRDFELGTLFTMVAGLLNLFIIFDAYWGPVDEEEIEAYRRRVQEEKARRKLERAERAERA